MTSTTRSTTRSTTTPTSPNIHQEIELAEKRAWEALAKYKFVMFGYWTGVWVHLNRIESAPRPNPWKQLVTVARTTTTGRTAAKTPIHNAQEQVQGVLKCGT